MVKPAEKQSTFTAKILATRLLKATIKTAIVIAIYAVSSMFIIPFEGLSNHQIFPTALILMYAFFVFAIEFARNTIFEHVFRIASSLMIMIFFAQFLNEGVFDFTVEQVHVTLDVHFFLAVFYVGSVLAFAKSMLQMLGWMNKREEIWLMHQTKSP